MSVLVLASASPRRAELLRAAGFRFEVVPAGVDETIRPGETPDDYVRRVAEAKAKHVAARTPSQHVLSADTVVVVDGEILGKPKDGAHAAEMLRKLSGRTHEVKTGVTLIAYGHSLQTEVETTSVEVAPLSDAEIAGYVESGEPLDKAGAYAIQGRAARFVTRIGGSYSNVVGLPVSVVYRLCRAAGIQVF
jgi:septum formation protein